MQVFYQSDRVERPVFAGEHKEEQMMQNKNLVFHLQENGQLATVNREFLDRTPLDSQPPFQKQDLSDRQLPAPVAPTSTCCGIILLVEDDLSVSSALRSVLKRQGYEVIQAADGLSALTCFEKNKVDLVLLDLHMPGLGGWATCERLTTINPTLPVIIITACADQKGTAKIMGVGAFMVKPLNIPLLLQTIQELLIEPEGQRLLRVTGRLKNTHCIPSNNNQKTTP